MRVAIVLAMGCGPAASGLASLQELRVEFAQGLSRVIGDFEEKHPDLDRDYKASLHRLQATGVESGDRNLVTAVRTEIERYLIEQTIPQQFEEATAGAIAELRQNYYRKLIDLLNARDLEILKAAERYERAVRKMQTNLKARGQRAQAQGLNDEIARIDKNPHVVEARKHIVFVSNAVAREPAVLPRKTAVPPRPSRRERKGPVPGERTRTLVFVRPQTDGTRAQPYYVGRWVWLNDAGTWQRELLLFNGAPRPAEGHKVWEYVQTMPQPAKRGARPWENFLYKRFPL